MTIVLASAGVYGSGISLADWLIVPSRPPSISGVSSNLGSSQYDSKSKVLSGASLIVQYSSGAASAEGSRT